jgi:CRISPR-associated endonuclease/helicase Cas3
MLYAKSIPTESIAEHTRLLLQGLDKLRSCYGKRIKADEEFWELLRLAVIVHDFGKVNLLFQNKLRRLLGEPELPCPVSPEGEIPHNYVSVALLPEKQLLLSREAWKLLVYAVGYHHERKTLPLRKDILEFMQNAVDRRLVEELFAEMNWSYEYEKPSNLLLNMLEKRQEAADEIKLDRAFFRRYVLLKGLLHRLDHAASAHVEVERGVDEHIGEKTLKFLSRYGIRPAQQFALEQRDVCTVMVASTGTGKTEAAMLWIDDAKGIITLPLRVSLNAMFTRLKDKHNVGVESLGLLHSGSFDYLSNLDFLDAEVSYQASRQLSEKLTLSTIDQVLKFPFLYRGFEKELATMVYTKVVVDEIQAYNPNIAAMLIKALETIAEMGGKFLVMTATLPNLYLEELRRRLRNRGISLAYGEFPNDDLLRHRIKLHDSELLESSDHIVQLGMNHKVLVICNTVDQAIRLYDELKRETGVLGLSVPVHLLHARFVKKHKMMLEQRITEFARSGWHLDKDEHGPGIWVTTQVVEASVDVDFDYLFTEVCTLDSLFQRMGRCYRVRPYISDEPNIHIFIRNASGIGHVYHKDITAMGVQLLREYEGVLLRESDKMEMVTRLYQRENLKDTEFLRKFDQALHLFDYIKMFDLSSQESQELLREISNVEVIPPKYWEEVAELRKRYIAETEPGKKRELRRQMEQYTVSLGVDAIKFRKIAVRPLEERGLEYMHWISHADVEYEFDEESLEGAGLRYRKSSDQY